MRSGRPDRPICRRQSLISIPCLRFCRGASVRWRRLCGGRDASHLFVIGSTSDAGCELDPGPGHGSPATALTTRRRKTRSRGDRFLEVFRRFPIPLTVEIRSFWVRYVTGPVGWGQPRARRIPLAMTSSSDSSWVSTARGSEGRPERAPVPTKAPKSRAGSTSVVNPPPSEAMSSLIAGAASYVVRTARPRVAS